MLLFFYELSFSSESFKHDSLKVTQQTTGKIRILFLGRVGLFVFSLQRYYFSAMIYINCSTFQVYYKQHKNIEYAPSGTLKLTF